MYCYPSSMTDAPAHYPFPVSIRAQTLTLSNRMIITATMFLQKFASLCSVSKTTVLIVVGFILRGPLTR